MTRSAAILTTVLALSPGYALSAGDAPAPRTSEVAIRELLHLTGAADAGIQVMQQLIPSLKQSAPDAPAEFWEGFMAEVKPEEMVDLLVPVYARYFTLEEIDELLRFNRTPLGQKLKATMPDIVRDSMAVGQEWGGRIAERAIAKLREKNIKVGP